MNEQRKKDLEFLEAGCALDTQNKLTPEALARQLLPMVEALRYLEEHGETVRQALDAETTNPRSPVDFEALVEAFRAYPRSL